MNNCNITIDYFQLSNDILNSWIYYNNFCIVLLEKKSRFLIFTTFFTAMNKYILNLLFNKINNYLYFVLSSRFP